LIDGSSIKLNSSSSASSKTASPLPVIAVFWTGLGRVTRDSARRGSTLSRPRTSVSCWTSEHVSSRSETLPPKILTFRGVNKSRPLRTRMGPFSSSFRPENRFNIKD
jgi:hypothetical protein